MKRWVKWAVFALGLALYLVLSVRGVALGDRTIVVGLAVDKSAEGMVVTAQVLVPVSGGEQVSGAGGGYVVTSVEAESLSEAFNKLAEVSGKAVALTHCNMFILGSGILRGDAYKVLDYVARNAYLSENAFILTAEKGGDILSTNVAYGEMTSLYLQEILNDRGIYSDIARRTVKEYVRSYCSHERGNWLPIVEKSETQNPNIMGVEQTKSAYVFTMNKTALLKGDEYVGTLTKSATEGLVYLTTKVEHGFVSIPSEGGGRISLYVIGSKSNIKYDYKTTYMEIELKLSVLIKELTGGGDMTKKELNEKEEKELKSAVRQKIDDLLGVVTENDVDIINMYNGFYRSGGKAWSGAESVGFINRIKYGVAITVSYE